MQYLEMISSALSFADSHLLPSPCSLMRRRWSPMAYSCLNKSPPALSLPTPPSAARGSRACRPVPSTNLVFSFGAEEPLMSFSRLDRNSQHGPSLGVRHAYTSGDSVNNCGRKKARKDGPWNNPAE